MVQYTNIVFLHGDDYDAMISELFPDLEEGWSPRGLIESEPERVMSYLSQWDASEVGEVREVRDDPGHGSADDVYEFGEQDYVVGVNTGLGYASLVRRLEEE
jgi:hypothetical protein